MRYSEAGFNLQVDLSTGLIEKIESDPILTELYLGGLGTNAKILWDMVGPEIQPLSPNNVIIFGPGLLTGTLAPGASHTIVTSISPQTHLMAYSIMGNAWGPELKHAGYDRVVFRGKAHHLVYLWVNNNNVEIRDAEHLRGKGTLETIEAIKEELKDKNIQILAIGPAGENCVYFATIEHSASSASRGGLGAIMGSKNLKAIAVRGTKDLLIAKPGEFLGLCKSILKYIEDRQKNPIKVDPKGCSPMQASLGIIFEGGEEWLTNSFSWGNARHRKKNFWTKEIQEKWKRTTEKVVRRMLSCYNCPLHCKASIYHPDVSNAYIIKCFSKDTYAFGAMTDNLEFGFKIVGLGTQYGVDSITAPQVMAFAVELYEAGILTDSDMPGFPPSNEERFFYLIEKIVRREGIGDVLADGVYWAARKIGRGAEAYDHNTIKKLEQIPIKLGTLNPVYYLMWATGEKIQITQIEGQFPQGPFTRKEDREEFAKDWFQVPKEEFKEYFVKYWEPGTYPYSPPIHETCEIVDWMEAMHYIDDCTGICTGLSAFTVKSPYHIHNLPGAISFATGMDLDEQGLLKIAKRVRNLVRAINTRRGLRRKDEQPPQDHWKKRFPEYEAKLLDEYYKFKGWNEDGIPTKETLRNLDLEYIIEDFEKENIL
jgi:aldehyde:ferredoxin oxidoreductase